MGRGQTKKKKRNDDQQSKREKEGVRWGAASQGKTELGEILCGGCVRGATGREEEYQGRAINDDKEKKMNRKMS